MVRAGQNPATKRCQNGANAPVAVPSAPMLLLFALFPYEISCPLLMVLTPVPLRVMTESLSSTTACRPLARMPFPRLFTVWL